MLNRMKVAGLLSFGPDGIDLPLEPLNVLIGPNGSGKTNFLEALGLLKAAPRDVLKPLTQWGGLRDWLWKGKSAPTSTSLEATVAYPPGENLRHMLSLGQMNGRLAVTNERIEPIGTCTNERAALSYFRPPRDEKTESYLRQLSPNSLDPNSSGSLLAHFLDDGIHFRSDYLPEVSLVSLANPHDYPALWHLKTHYESIHLYRDWSFGPLAGLRKPASAHDRADFLNESGANLAPVLSNFPGKTKRQLIAALQKLYDGVVDVKTPVVGGTVTVFLEEDGNREIPATRLSDGTLRYLCLMAILLHPNPPPLVVIEEPELGLHPDLLPTLTDFLISASERCQLIITTHSDVLVDALTDKPESVVVCEKHDGQSSMQRLDKADLQKWLQEYSLGNLWSSGQIGGNRW